MNPGTAISYDNNNLQTTNILTSLIDHETPAEPDAKVYALSHANAIAVPSTSYPSKTVNIAGTILGTGIANLDAFLDTFRGYFNGSKKNLDIAYNGGTRRYIVMKSKPDVKRPGGLNFGKYTVEFTCQPFGMDTASTTLIAGAVSGNAGFGRTLGSYSDSVTFAGSAPFQKPIFTVTLTAVTGATNQPITIGNNANGQALTITRTWTAGDILVIDTTTKTATVNGIIVDFSGAFPEFPAGVQSISYTDGFTTRTFNYGVIYNKLYK